MTAGLFESGITFWYRIDRPNEAVSDFSADIERLVEAYHRLPPGPMEDEAADFPSILADADDDGMAAAKSGNSRVPGLCETADAIARGETTAVNAVELCLERIKSGKKINAVIRYDAEAALAMAQQADALVAAGEPLQKLSGLPLGHKDMFYRDGEPVTCGSLIRQDYRADRTASVLTRLDGQGAIHLASLNMSEFAQGPTGHNRHFGPTRNPWDLSRVTGGSSAGSGAAVASGMVLASLGSDTGGSVRLPASACGVTGLKPTWSRVTRYGAMPLAPSLDCVGPLARSARDCARLMSIIAGPDGLDPTATELPVPDYEAGLDGDIRGIRLGIPASYFLDGVDDAILGRFDAALDVLAARGASRASVELAAMDEVATYSAILSKVEVATVHAQWMRTRAQDYAIHVNSRMYPGFAIPGVFYLQSLRRRGAVLRAFMAAAFAKTDVLVMPTIKTTPPTIAETDVDAGTEGAIPKFLSLSANTRAFNYLGLPAITIPIGLDGKGMPAGLQIVGKPFSDGLLLRIADAFQRDTAWHLAMPGQVQ
jgi:aspartyl-tRNA(Asn)/glutamyl-tRNA(Gln) amidotransferase subunit A